MSLVGNLEELGLGEILQIVSLSRKTGVLSLSSLGKDGSVFFRQGEVVRAASSTHQQSLGEVLIQKGVVDLPVLRKALALQQENGYCERLGVILVNNFGVLQEIIEEVVREQIEKVVFSLFAWGEGTFKFDALNSVETVDGAMIDPMQFMLEQGLNPQFLAMEGTRIKRHAAETGLAEGKSSEDAADFAFNLVDSLAIAAPSREIAQQPIVIVDDDGPTLRAIADGLIEKGFVVYAMTRSEDTLIKVDTLHRGGGRPTVLVDMIMPKMDGSGLLGGVELLELLHNNFKDLQLIVMTDYRHEEAEKTISELGYSYIIKPRRVEIKNSAIMANFLARITHDLRYNSVIKTVGEGQNLFNPGDDLSLEMAEDDDMPRAVESSQQSGGLSMLRGIVTTSLTGILLFISSFLPFFWPRQEFQW